LHDLQLAGKEFPVDSTAKHTILYVEEHRQTSTAIEKLLGNAGFRVGLPIPASRRWPSPPTGASICSSPT
jgi:hypothetical protein